MIGATNLKNKERSPTGQHLKKSSIVTELESQRKERIANLYNNRRQMSHSTFLDFCEDTVKGNFHKTSFRKDTNDHLLETQDDLKRARSLKSMAFQKPKVEVVEKNTAHELNQNVIKLKMEEMCFKFKTKIGSLLKQLNSSAQQIARFGSLERIEDLLNFLSERVRQKLVQSQLSEAGLQKAWSKQKHTLNEYQAQIDNLKKKLQDKEANEKIFKTKIRDSHGEEQILLDKIHQKEKELSLKVTEVYQFKTSLKESESTIENMQHRIQLLEEELKSVREQLESDSKGIININLNLKEQNQKFKEKVQDLEEEVQQLTEKTKTLTEMNKQASMELTRWRQRFEDVDIAEEESYEQSSEKTNQFVEVVVVPTNQLKKSTMSMNSFQLDNQENSSLPRVSLTALEIENLKLGSKVSELQKQNKQLSKDILNYATIKERYEKTLSVAGDASHDLNAGLNAYKIEYLKERAVDLYQIQLEAHYKHKLEQTAKEWKQKLYDIVHRYEDETENLKQKIDAMMMEKEQLQKKIVVLATQKYQLQNKIIAQEQKIYEISKSTRKVERKSSRLQKETVSMLGISEGKISEKTGGEEICEGPQIQSQNEVDASHRGVDIQ